MDDANKVARAVFDLIEAHQNRREPIVLAHVEAVVRSNLPPKRVGLDLAGAADDRSVMTQTVVKQAIETLTRNADEPYLHVPLPWRPYPPIPLTSGRAILAEAQREAMDRAAEQQTATAVAKQRQTFIDAYMRSVMPVDFMNVDDDPFVVERDEAIRRMMIDGTRPNRT